MKAIFPIAGMSACLLLLFFMLQFLDGILNKHFEQVHGTETRVEKTDNEIESYEITRENEKFLFMDLAKDYVILHFQNGDSEVFNDPDDLVLTHGNKNVFEDAKVFYSKDDSLKEIKKTIYLDEDTYKKFTREYTETFKSSPSKN